MPASGWQCTPHRPRAVGSYALPLLCVNSLTLIRPNTQLHRTAPTPAAPPAPTHRTGASSPLKAWSSQPTTPEATGLPPHHHGTGSWAWPPLPVPRRSRPPVLSKEMQTQFVDMKKSLYYNNDQFYAAWLVVGQIAHPRRHGTALFRVHVKDQHPASPARNRLRRRVGPCGRWPPRQQALHSSAVASMTSLFLETSLGP